MRLIPLRTLFAAALLLCLPLMATADTLQPFTTDGCTAFPNGTFHENELWLSCCVAHDYAYWQGGTYDERLAADEALRACVAAVGEPTIAEVMLAGVRVGGTPYFPTKFRWGYGWPFLHGYTLRGYKVLSAEEREQIAALSVPANSPVSVSDAPAQ
ncbi:MAG: hypothetical protein LBF16_15475 [Pseudomonadales bacterium]|nr:hypothetical protein [Pseudomonadales bacterium]